MSRSRFPRIFVAVLLAAALWVPGAWAAPHAAPADLSLGLLARLWDALGGLWAASGCMIDPHGGCGAGPQAASGVDEGCMLDPHGGCVTSRQVEEPLPSPAGDEGCMLDPNGGCKPGS